MILASSTHRGMAIMDNICNSQVRVAMTNAPLLNRGLIGDPFGKRF
jgi:hypothetical protein